MGDDAVIANGGAKPVLGMIGGAGTLGSGLAYRWAKAGFPILIGSRDAARARQAAAELRFAPGAPAAQGASYADAAASADVVVVTVPFAHHGPLLDQIRPVLRGQLVLDATVPLSPGRKGIVQLSEFDSAAVAAQRRLGSAARVVSAFHNVPAKKLREDEPIDCDVLVFGDSAPDREAVIRLIEAAALRGVHGGPLANSLAAEALAAVLIGINRHYGIRNAGLRITGL
jgi:8-hydroxy-5-deazaflavin:NADPH oxidoreductase